MRHKINNARKGIQSPFGMSDYYKYFKYYFDFYLSPRPDFDFLEEVSELYIPAPEVEDCLSLLRGNQSFCVLLVGHTGIGKSTIVRNYLNVLRNKPVINPDEEEIVIPYFCNNQVIQNDAATFFASGIRYVADQLIKRLSKSFKKEDLWDFIDNNKPTSLTTFRKGEFQSKKDDLRILLDQDHFT